MGDEALALLLGPCEYSVTDPQRAAAPTLDEANSRRRRFGMPLLGYAPDIPAVVHGLHPEHRDFRHAARLVECPPWRTVDQAFSSHILEKPFQIDFILSVKIEGARDFPLPLARDAGPHSWQGVSALLRDRLAAIVTFLRAFAAGSQGSSTQHSVLHGIVDLILNRAIASPSAGHVSSFQGA